MKSVPLLLAGLVLLVDGAAHAQTEVRPDFELKWIAPASCPDKASLRAQVAKLAPSPAARERPLRIDGVVRSGANGFELDLVLRDGEFEGRRRFESESCAELVGAAAVTIALLMSSGSADPTAEATVDPGAAGTAGAPRAEESFQPRGDPPRDVDAARARSPGAPAARQEPTSGAASAPADTRDLDADRRWRLVLAAPSLSIGFALLPDANIGLGGGAGVEFESWRVLMNGAWHFDSSVRLAGASDQGADLSRGVLRLATCHWFGWGRWQLAPCATLALTYLVAHGVGAGVAAEEADAAWLGAGPGLVAGLGLTQWVRLAASAGLELQTSRPVLVIEGLGEVEQIGALELFTLVGAEWIF